LKDLLGDTIQNMLEAELDEHLGYEKYESTEEAKSNYRNGYTSKTLKSSVGQVGNRYPAGPECRIRAENCSQV